MFSRRRLTLIAAAVACLLPAAGASADPLNTFSAIAAPSHVKPSSSMSFTVMLTNDPASPDSAHRATVAIPSGFSVAAPSVQATTTAAGSCGVFTWVADGELIADQKINLKRPGADNTALCPGATLTVAFTATSGAAEGTYPWTSVLFRGANDVFTLTGSQPSVIVDGTAPTVGLTGKPNNPSNDASPNFAFSASETSTFECKLDAAAFTACTSPRGYTGMTDGSHMFTVRGTDTAGNTGEASYTWTVDTVAPTASIGTKPSNPSADTSPGFAFSASETSTFQCKLDAAAFAACASPRGYTGVTDGSHTFTVRAIDAAGNPGVATYIWDIDTVAPAVTITGQPTNPSNVKSPSFSFTAEPNATVECKLDQGAVEPCSSPKTYSNLADGAHAFAVRAKDAAGNTATRTYSWAVDTAAPTTTIGTKPATLSNDATPSFGFTASEPATFQCKLDGEPFAACATPKTYTTVADGAHSFAVRAIDTAGNIGASASYGWTIDTFAPTTTITQKPASLSSTSSATFAFAASEAGSAFACRLDNGSFSSCASPNTYTNLSDGSHTFAVRATDAAGNTGPDVAYGWTIETRSPTAALTLAPAGLSNSRSATFGFSADEPATFECNLDQRGFEPCSSPATYDGLGDGQHGFSVRARDAVGNFSAPVSQSWTIDATAPETTISSVPKSGTATSATFAFSATEGGTFECRLDGAPFAVCASPKSYNPLRPGDHRFEVRAVDAAGNADPTPALHTWKIDAPLRKLTSTALLSPTAGARVKRPPLLVWKRVARAGYYNVQVYRGKVKVFSRWPIRTRLQMKSRWRFQGRMRKLTPGTYRWYVWPGYGAPAARRYGSLLGQSTFVVAKR